MALEIKIEIQKNMSAQIKQAEARALEKCGLQGEKYAKEKCPVVTDRLRGSISHIVNDDTAYIGTNVEYAPYVELGTGVYCTMGGGRSGWWVYVPGSSSSNRSGKNYTYEEARRIVAILRSRDIDAHMTQGRKAKPYLKPAVADHAGDYRKIIEGELRSG